MTREYLITADAWRHNVAVIDECLFWIPIHRKYGRERQLAARCNQYRKAMRRAYEFGAEIGKHG